MSVRENNKQITLRHANVLNRAREDLTRDQRRLIILCMRQLQVERRWPENGIFKFTRAGWASFFGVGENEAGNDIKKAINGMKGKVVAFSDVLDDVNMDLEIDWTISRWSNVNKGFYAIELHPRLQRYLMPVIAGLDFTLSQFDQWCELKTRWSQKLYSELMQFSTTGVCILNVDDVRIRWGLPSSYDKWSALRIRVIDPSIEELRVFQQFKTLTMSVKTEGKKVIALMFNFPRREEWNFEN